MNATDVPLVFSCEGSALIGMVHVPEKVTARGLIFLVAGGPQYRGGVGRQQTQMSRELAAQGIPVMRFDYRGVGDSEGQFLDFEHVGDDLAAAIEAFMARVPAMREIVLWGGCNAASAIMMNAWKFPMVTGMVVSNPWVHMPEMHDAVVVRRHYGQRIRELEFWLKIARLQYNPVPALGTLMRGANQQFNSFLSRRTPASADPMRDDSSQHFILRMRLGMERFKGDMLLLMSGRSMVSKEFDDLLAKDTLWQAAMRSPRNFTRHNMPFADQTQSSIASRHELVAVAAAWMFDPRAELSKFAVEDADAAPIAD